MTEKTQSAYPDQGELFKASNKKHDALIFFVHFYLGHKKALLRHIRLVNQLGYDAYVFNIKDKLKDHYGLPYSLVSHKFGLKHAIADQIEEHMNLLTEYPKKIAYAFSNVSACCIEAMARRPHQDFIALICDSGPSLNFMDSAYALYKHSNPVALPLRFIAAPLMAYGWSKDMHKDIPGDLMKLPQGFPVLSIRGWKDPLIKPNDIDLCFEPCKNLVWQKLSLPEAGHLTGLRDFPQEYKPVVDEFLKSVN